MLADAAAIRDVLLSEKARAPLASRRTIIQMETFAPAQSCALADEIGASGGDYPELPVLGCTSEMQAHTLIVVVIDFVERERASRRDLSPLMHSKACATSWSRPWRAALSTPITQPSLMPCVHLPDRLLRGIRFSGIIGIAGIGTLESWKPGR